MQKLLSFLISNITGTSAEIEEQEVDNRFNYIIKADPAVVGIIIGKEGKTIRSIRKIMSIKATLENKLISITIADNL